MSILIVAVALLISGCNAINYVDWHGVWLGCPKGQIEKPAYRGAFGIVKNPSYCEDAPTKQSMDRKP